MTKKPKIFKPLGISFEQAMRKAATTNFIAPKKNKTLLKNNKKLSPKNNLKNIASK